MDGQKDVVQTEWIHILQCPQCPVSSSCHTHSHSSCVNTGPEASTSLIPDSHQGDAAPSTTWTQRATSRNFTFLWKNSAVRQCHLKYIGLCSVWVEVCGKPILRHLAPIYRGKIEQNKWLLNTCVLLSLAIHEMQSMWNNQTRFLCLFYRSHCRKAHYSGNKMGDYFI